jgi:hypothetical protein
VTSPSLTSNTSHDIAKVGDSVGFGQGRPGNVDSLYMASEIIVQETGGAPHLLQSIKTRFTSACSAVAWPRRLGLKLGMSNPPRLQAYGWNAATRVEANPVAETTICTLVSLKEAKRYASIYFIEVNRTSRFWTRVCSTNAATISGSR